MIKILKNATSGQVTVKNHNHGDRRSRYISFAAHNYNKNRISKTSEAAAVQILCRYILQF